MSMNTTTIGDGTEEVKPNGRRPEPGERERVLADWAASGRTVEQMAAATGWSTYTLYRWRHTAGARKSPKIKPAKRPSLLPVPKPPSAVTGSWAAEVAIGTVSVRLSPGSPVGWIGQLVRELRSC